MKEHATVIQLLQTSIRLYRTHSAFYTGFVAWLLFPVAVLLTLDLFVLPAGLLAAIAIVFSFIQLILSLWVTILLTIATDKIIGHALPSDHTLEQLTWKLMVPVILVAVLQFLAVFGGFILLIVPGILFAVWFAFAQMAVMLEKKQGVQALSYSRSLVRGRFFQVLWKLLAGPAIVYITYSVVLALVLMLVSLFGNIDPQLFLEGDIPIWLETIDAITQVFLLPILIIYFTLTFRYFSRINPPEEKTT